MVGIACEKSRSEFADEDRSSSKATILFVDHATAIGGAEKSLLMLLERLDRNRWSPHVACSPGDFSRAVRGLAIPVRHLDMPSLRRLPRIAWLRTVRSLAFHIAADLVYANTARGALYTSMATFFSHRRFIWHVRDFSFVENANSMVPLDRVLKRMVSRCASAVVANSRAVAMEMPYSDRVQVIHNGIDLASFCRRKQSSEARRFLNLSPEVRVVGMLGRLRPWKGQGRFLRIAAQVQRRMPDTHFVIAGGDPFEVDDGYARRLPEYAKELGLEDRVAFTGQLNEVADVLAAMDIFVHPGDPEPFGLVNLEAMAMGKPIVAFAHGALPEIVKHNVTGVLVEPCDEEACAAAITHLLKSPARMRDFGAAGRARVEEFFQISRTVSAVEDLLQQHVGGSCRESRAQ